MRLRTLAKFFVIACLAIAGTSAAQVTTTTQIASSKNPSSLGELVTFTATVTGASPTGTVLFVRAGTPVGFVPLSNGSATVTTSRLVLGSNAMTAEYSGDPGNLASSSAPLAQNVSAAPAGTRPYLLRDINLSAPNLLPFSPPTESLGGVRFFHTVDAGGDELWKTDGTAAGTGRVKDIYPGPGSSQFGAWFKVLPPIALFNAYAPGSGGVELWRTDGTSAGTQLLKDICPGACGSLSQSGRAAVLGSNVYFFADDGTSGAELWKSDGTSAGTVMVKDINPGAASAQPIVFFEFGFETESMFATLGGTLIFTADDGTNGAELWKSDGTAAGTVLLKDLTPGSGGTTFEMFSPQPVSIGGLVFFLTRQGDGHVLWRTDGTAAGTLSLATFDSRVSTMVAAQGSANPAGILFLGATDSINGGGLWASDGTVPGTVPLVTDPTFEVEGPSSLASVDGSVYFAWGDPTNGVELWKSGGTVATTVMVQDILPGSGSSVPRWITEIAGTLYFFASDDVNGFQPWTSDGSATGAALLKVIGTSLNSMPTFGGFFFPTPAGVVFLARDEINGPQLWRTDGTTAGTAMLAQVTFGSEAGVVASTNQSAATIFGEKLFIIANDGLSGLEPWVSDGTSAGTFQLADVRAGPSTSNPFNSQSTLPTTLKGTVVNPNPIVLFRANNGSQGVELWKTDGTIGGTSLVLDINSGPGPSIPFSLVNVNGTGYFTADDGSGGFGLWKSDGTGLGTSMVQLALVDIGDLVNFNGTLYFRHSDGVGSNQLWKSDGTAPGTVLVKDVIPGYPVATMSNFTVVNGLLYFTVLDPVLGIELWKSDGTGPGTVMVKDINPTGDSSPASLIAVGGTLYFMATDGVNGVELWKSDGTSAGTTMVADLAPGPASSALILARAGSRLVFMRSVTGATFANGATQLWVSDGTLAGTTLLMDICAGKLACLSTAFPVLEHSGSQFLFLNDDTGRHLWRTDGSVSGTSFVADLPQRSTRVLGSNTQGFYLTNIDHNGREPWFFAFDRTPDAFGFAPATVATSTIATSNAIVINGIEAGVVVTIDPSSTYSIGCTGTFVNTPGTINPGQTVCVRHTSAASGGTQVTTTLTIGGVSGTFISTTGVAPVITSANATTFTIGTAGTFTVTTTGAPTPVRGLTGTLPAGVTFTPATGVLAGTPVPGTVGAIPLTFTATNGVAPAASQPFTLTIAKGNQAIDFPAPANRLPGSPPFTISATGGASGNPVVFTTPDTVVCATAGTNGTTVVLFSAGICVIHANQAGDASYNAAPQVVRSFDVKGQQAITFATLPDRLMGSANFTVSATGGASGLPVVFSTTTTAVCVSGGASGATIALVGPGTCTIHADQAGNAQYSPAPRVSRSFTVVTSQPDPARVGNISTRLQVGTGDDVLIGGFVIGGSTTKRVAIVATGPSLAAFGITNPLANPTLRLVRSSDQAVLATSDDWQTAANQADLTAAGLAPSNSLEAAILVDLAPGAYTAIVEGAGGVTGVSVIGVYEVNHPETPLINISTRGRVLTGNDVMIGGFVINGTGPQTLAIVATGPSLAAFGIANPLANPTLTLVRSSDQVVIATNDDWQQASNAADLTAAGFAPSSALEAALLVTLPPGAYTAIVQGSGTGTGVAVIGVYKVGP